MIDKNGCDKGCCQNINIMKFKKLHPDAVKPTLGKEGDAAYDITAIDDGTIGYDKQGRILYIEYKTGLAFQPPKGYYYRIQPRSSLCKYDLILANHVPIFDQNYRGEVLLRFKVTSVQSFIPSAWTGTIESYYKATISEVRKHYNIFKKGDRIAQMTIEKSIHMNMIEVEELDDTNRGEGRFGSSGK